MSKDIDHENERCEYLGNATLVLRKDNDGDTAIEIGNEILGYLIEGCEDDFVSDIKNLLHRYTK